MNGSSRRLILGALGVTSLAALPYLFTGVLDAPFVFDDVKLVRDNATIRDLSRMPETFNIFSKKWEGEELRANYRPMRFLSYAIDYRITRWIYGDFKPEALPTAVFRAHNVILHSLNALLVFLIGYLLFGEVAAALVLGAVFAVHPIMTEAVAYVSGRRDVLSTFYFLAALWIHLRGGIARRDPEAGSAPAPLRVGALVAVPVLFVLGLLSKEMVVTLPAVLLLIDLARRARFDARRTILMAVLWSLALAFAALETANPRLVAGAVGGSRTSALLTAPRYLARYLSLLFFPYPQSIDYSFDAIPASTSLLDPWTTLPSIILVLALVAAGIHSLLRRRLALSVGILWFAGTLTPVLQLVPIPERFAERFAYLPAIGVFLLAAGAFAGLRRRSPSWAWGLAGTALALLCAFAGIRASDWKSPEDLWGSAVRAQPRAARAHLGYGHALGDSGKLRDAAREYGLCLSILGEEPPPGLLAGEPLRARSDEFLHWGQVLQARAFRAEVFGKLGAENDSGEYYRKAVDEYRWILRQRDIDGTEIAGSPKFLVTRFNLGGCLLGLALAEAPGKAGGLRAEAAQEYRRVVRDGADPGLVRAARYYLSKIALAEGRAGEGLKELEEAFRIARESGDRMDRYSLAGELSDLLIESKEYDRADDLLKASIAELGNLPERKHLLFRRSKIADRRGDLSGAIRILEGTLEIDPEYGPALLTLAGMEENRGNLDRAEELYRRLLLVAPGEAKAAKGLKNIQIRRDLARKDGGKAAADDRQAEEGRTRVIIEGLIERGEGHLSRKEILAAVEPFRRAADTAAAAPDPEKYAAQRARALMRLAFIARELRDYPKAQDYLKEAFSADPGAREALRELGDLQLRNLHDREAAERTYQEYLDTFREGELAESWIYINLASLLQERSPSRAIDLYLSGKKACSGSPEALRKVNRALGYLLSQVGRWEEALDCFQEYLEQSEEQAAGDPIEAKDREKVRAYLRDEVLVHLKGGEDLPEKSRSGGPPGKTP